MIKKKLCVVILLILSIDTFAQTATETVLDIISGKVYIEDGEKVKLIKQKLGLSVKNDVTIRLASDDAWIIGRKNEGPIFLTQELYPDGVKLQDVQTSKEGKEEMVKVKKDIIDFFDKSEEYFGWLPLTLLSLFENDTILEDSPLWPGRFHVPGGQYRGINTANSITEWTLLYGYNSMIDWEVIDEDNKPLKVIIEDIKKDKILFSEEQNPPLILNKDLMSQCHPCKLSIPSLKIEIIINSKHFDTQEKQIAFNGLLKNKSESKNLSLSQFLIIKMLINNGFYGNAAYYIEEYKETNEFVKEYLELME